MWRRWCAPDVIEDSSYVWWAIRPSLQASDAGVARAGLLHAGGGFASRSRRSIARWRDTSTSIRWRNADLDAVTRAIVVENKWRAQRYGVHGTFVTEEGAVTVAEMLDRSDRGHRGRCRGARLRRRDQPLPAIVGAGHFGRRPARGVSRRTTNGQPRGRAARRHRLDRHRNLAMIAVRPPAASSAPRSRALARPLPRAPAATNSVSACT